MTSNPDTVHARSAWIKRFIWLYFWLLLFEGALRRWILPGLSGPLLVVREPVAILIIGLALKSGIVRMSPALLFGIFAGLFSFSATFVFGHGNLAVAAFGLRIFLLHFPLLFIIPRVFDALDVAKMGRALCFVGLIMTPLVAAQFFLPQSHRVNIGIGGGETAGFTGAEGRFRPPGTFSFTNGVSLFYSLYGATIAFFALHSKVVKRWWWVASVFSLVIAIPLTISRSVLFSVIITGGVLALVGIGNKHLRKRFVLGAIVLSVVISTATFVPAFREGMIAFSTRWSTANEVEGGVQGIIMDRFLGGLVSALLDAHRIPILGYGLGLGTNAGAALLTGEREFMIAEGEWGRLIGEMGPILGIAVIILRVGIAISLAHVGIRAWRAGNPMSILLASVTILWVAQGNWAQPTFLGFAILGGGLTAAAANVHRPPGVGVRHARSRLTPIPAGPAAST